MKTPFATRYLASALVAALAVYVSACSQATDNAGAPAATTTVGTEIDDGVLTTRIKSALLDDADVKSFDLKVETRKGEVLLSGFVDNASQMERAVAVTRAISGVKNIDNKMTVKVADTTVGNKVDDAVITTKVKSALLADTSIKSLDIAVVTRKGEVQLSGFVNNQTQIDHAVAVARAIEGVSSVGNEMSIKK
jgi:hyperosmotically inducible protein